MKAKTLIIFSVLVIALSIFGVWHFGQSKTKSYYSGDAIEYHGQLIIASANTGFLEIFKFVNGKLVNVIKRAAPVDAQVRSSAYNDVLLNQENDNLFVYAASGSTVYKYDFSDLQNLPLANSRRDTTWDWFGHLAWVNGRLMTAGSRAVKFWNPDLEVVDSFNLVNSTNPYNIVPAGNDRWLFNLTGSQVDLFGLSARQISRSLPVNVNLATGNKRVYFDAPANLLYVADDAALKKMSLTGDLYKTLAHSSQFGYDVVASSDEPDNLYFSNGYGVTKVSKIDFKRLASFDNDQLAWPNSWAMGLKLVDTVKGEVVVVFNNSNILVLDKNLLPYATAAATEEETGAATANESLFLRLDVNNGYVGNQVAVSGGGFAANENITLFFGGVQWLTTADASGRFTATVTVPESARNKTGIDLKAIGSKSGLSYSAGFYIKR